MIYIDRRHLCVGYHRGDGYHYIHPLPGLVIRWKRRWA